MSLFNYAIKLTPGNYAARHLPVLLPSLGPGAIKHARLYANYLISIFMTSLTLHYRGRGGRGGEGNKHGPRSVVHLFGRPFVRPDTNDLISTSPAPARLRRGGGGVTLGWFYCCPRTRLYLLLTAYQSRNRSTLFLQVTCSIVQKTVPDQCAHSLTDALMNAKSMQCFTHNIPR